MKTRKLLPTHYLWLSTAAMVLSFFLLPGPVLLRGPWRLLGLLPVGLGIALALWADALFKKVGTEIKPFRESKLVVEEGPYRFSRHPMYISFLLVLGGGVLIFGCLGPLLVFLAMTWLLRAHFAIPEEQHMEEQFGEAYHEYKRRVRRWL